MTSKELVYAALEFRNTGRAPRHLWTLPWAEKNHPEYLQHIKTAFPDDIITCPAFLREKSAVAKGDPYAIGESIDEWGCVFTNVQSGIIGEVKQPVVIGAEWEDAGSTVHFPVECLTVDTDKVNRFCGDNSEKFILSGCCPRPFERLQFIRGTQNIYIDLMDPPKAFLEFIHRMHEHYCQELLLWAKTDVDGLTFMDDWGAQRSLLINPKLWEEIFKPLYKDYIDIAHQHGKKAFMHSDGYILDIYPQLIELGLDAINSQLFCIGLEQLEQFRGKITFWGEMDRQHLLPNGQPKDIKAAVEKIHTFLYENGGCIAQCEFGPGAKPENVYALYESWNQLS